MTTALVIFTAGFLLATVVHPLVDSWRRSRRRGPYRIQPRRPRTDAPRFDGRPTTRDKARAVSRALNDTLNKPTHLRITPGQAETIRRGVRRDPSPSPRRRAS